MWAKKAFQKQITHSSVRHDEHPTNTHAFCAQVRDVHEELFRVVAVVAWEEDGG